MTLFSRTKVPNSSLQAKSKSSVSRREKAILQIPFSFPFGVLWEFRPIRGNNPWFMSDLHGTGILTALFSLCLVLRRWQLECSRQVGGTKWGNEEKQGD